MNIISTTRARLYRKKGFRYRASMVTRLKLVEVPDGHDIDTAATDGKHLFVCRQFVESLSMECLSWILAHEADHCLYRHHLRLTRLLRDHFPDDDTDNDTRKQILHTWNVAADYFINSNIPKREDIEPWEDRLICPPRYVGMSVEEMFWDMWHVSPNNDSRDQPCDMLPYPCDDQDVEFVEKREVRAIERAIAGCEASEVPEELALDIRDIKQGVIGFRDILSPFLVESAPNDYSYSVPNRRYSDCGFVRPGLSGYIYGNVLWIGDTSGSMLDDQSEAVGELQHLIETMNADQPNFGGITCLWADTDVYRQDLKRGDVPQPVGGGGTDFRRAMEYVEQHRAELNPCAIIFFTDGCTRDWGKDPGIPVLWIAKRRDFTPPYGRVARFVA